MSKEQLFNPEEMYKYIVFFGDMKKKTIDKLLPYWEFLLENSFIKTGCSVIKKGKMETLV